MSETNEEYSDRMFREARPFADGLGMRGPIPRLEPIRQVHPSQGDLANFQVDPQQVDTSDPQMLGDSTGGGATIPKIVIAFNGELHYCNLRGDIGAVIPP